MKMKSKNVLYLIILIIANTLGIIFCQFNGKCGYPGKPYKAKLEPDNKLIYDEGEEVTYQCVDYWSFVKTRKCEKGRWTGEQPRCADYVNGILMKDSKAEDITNPDKPILMFEHLNMTITNTTWRYPNVFTSNRFKKARLRIFDTHKYRWTFRFTKPFNKLFVRINFNFINYTFLTQQQKDNFTFIVSVFISPERKCELIHQSDDAWRDNGRKTDSDFTCDSFSHSAYQRDIKNPGDYLIMETQANIALPHDLIAVFFGKTYGTEEEPICGDPQISIGQSSRFNVQYKDYLIDCKTNWIYVPTEHTIDTRLHKLICASDMKWNGSYPVCIPRNPCPMENLLISPRSNQTVITSIDGLYYLNDTYYAIEGAEVNYGCSNPSTDILVGKESRTCNKKGKWTGSEPYCYDPNESTKFSVWLLIGILLAALVLVICLTGILFYVYTKRIKNRIKEQIATQHRPESENFDTYDDVDFVEGKQIYDTYDMVREERYAGPYYSAEQDYVQMPADVHIQSNDDYWRIPGSEPRDLHEPEYLVMTSSAKPSPSPRRPPKNNTYEL